MVQDTFRRLLSAPNRLRKRDGGSTAIEYVMLLFSIAVGTCAIILYLGINLSNPFVDLTNAFHAKGPSPIGGMGGIFSGDAGPPPGNAVTRPEGESHSPGGRMSHPGTGGATPVRLDDARSRPAKGGAAAVGLQEPRQDTRKEWPLENVRVVSTDGPVFAAGGASALRGVTALDERSLPGGDSLPVAETEDAAKDVSASPASGGGWSSRAYAYQPAPIYNPELDYLILLLFMGTFIFVYIRNRIQREQI